MANLSKVLLVMAIITYLTGLIAGNVFEINIQSLNLNNQILSSTIFTIAVFCLSITSFGKFSPIVAGIAGLMQSKGFLAEPATAILVIPTLIAINAGITAGQALEEEMKESKLKFDPKKNIQTIKSIAIMLAIAVVIAIAIEAFKPQIIEIVNNALNGLNQSVQSVQGQPAASAGKLTADY